MLLRWFVTLLPLFFLFQKVHSLPIHPFPDSDSGKSNGGSSKKKYSTYQCIGGSQVFNQNSMKQASIKVWPLNDPEFRTCHYRNVCLVNGTLTFFQKFAPSDKDGVPKEYLPAGFDGYVNHLSYLRGFTMQIKSELGAIPEHYPFSTIPTTFLDSCSWSFNYGHYINDNIMPTFVAAKLFKLPFTEGQQLFETSCRLFSTLEPAFANRIVTYNHSMGTYRDACLHRLNSMWIFFYKNPPIYVDDLMQKTLCFPHLVTGQGSSYGLKSLDLSRGLYFRDFRDYVLSRITLKPPQQVENLILVGLRTVGSAGGQIINDLCELSHRAHANLLTPEYKTKYRVECFVPSNLQLEEEIYQVQRAKVLISVHGTITYMSLFSRDGTQQISVANPKELKENQMLLYATHFNTLYLTWDKLDNLRGVLEHALQQSEAFYEED
jgi:hypothetical protein